MNTSNVFPVKFGLNPPYNVFNNIYAEDIGKTDNLIDSPEKSLQTVKLVIYTT